MNNKPKKSLPTKSRRTQSENSFSKPKSEKRSTDTNVKEFSKKRFNSRQSDTHSDIQKEDKKSYTRKRSSSFENRNQEEREYRKPSTRKQTAKFGNNERESTPSKKLYSIYANRGDRPNNRKSSGHNKSFDKRKPYSKANKGKRYQEEAYPDEHMKFEWPIRLNRYISNAGICGRRDADKLILDGYITVNGQIVTELGTKVEKRDEVKYRGNKILPEKPIYILMNKPKNYITTTKDESDRQTVMDLIKDEIDVRVYPVGRLDRKTTGVLLLTNDGELAQKLTHPSFDVKKIYEVTLKSKATLEELEKLATGIELEDGVAYADLIAFPDANNKTIVGIEIHSGKNRIVRRMFEALGHTVEKLDRVSFGPFTKKGVERGKFRFLKNSEIAQLKRAKKKLS
ncbi:MAG: rRNA pseudouridine synthase [Bacteroidia bacterium]|nr:rRNA pseudouridine synthase [Bacteroidia bacterium]